MNHYQIRLQLEIDPDIGAPIYFDGCTNRRYIPWEHEIPLEFTKWLSGHSYETLYDYLFIVNNRIGTIRQIYEHYPDYDELPGFDTWTPSNHAEFKVALEWFSKYDMYTIDVWDDLD
jgi:hypothetical protein